MGFSKQQLEAINTVNKNIMVSASAGAGKTAVLIERMMKRIINDHVSLDRILAMTFTEAAALEMKKRLTKQLNEVLVKKPNDEYIKQQLILLQDAKISTIHSFCLDIIKKYGTFIDLDPSLANNILEEGTINLLLEESFNEALSSMLETNHDKTIALLEHFSSRSEDYEVLRKAVTKLIKNASASFDEDAYYDKCLNNYPIINSFKDYPNDIKDYYIDSVNAFVDEELSYLNTMKDINNLKYQDEKAATTINKKISLFNNVKDNTDNSYQDLYNSLLSLAEYETSTIKDAPDYKAIRESLNKKQKDFLTDVFEERILIKNSKQDHVLTVTIVELAKQMSKLFSKKKLELCGLNFDDMEVYAYKILCANDYYVSNMIKASLDEIMVDEFQDTNEMQNAIINLIGNGHNTFRVGDIKQSIYRFRKAKPSIMKDIIDNDKDTYKVFLPNNFRSKENIVTFTNNLFNVAMNIEGINNTYKEVDNVTVGLDEQKVVDKDSIYFYGIHSDSKDEEDNEETLSNKMKKASFIALKIKELHESSNHKMWKDYTVLVRNHADKIELKETFDRYEIPYYIDAKEGFYQSYTCSILLSLIKYLINPKDTISLVSTLTSKIFNFTDDDLAKVKIEYEYINNETINQAFPSFSETINHFNNVLNTYGLCRLLSEVSICNDFYNNHLDKHQKTNFDLFYEKAVEFDKSSLSIYEFINQIEANLEEKTSEAVSISNDDDLVKVVTIHQSKGLQYPVVFYWSTSKSLFKDKAEPLLVDSDLGFGINTITTPYRIKFPNVTRKAIEHKLNLDDLAENVRLLYVAITRAQDSLYIVDIVDNVSEELPTLGSLNKRKGTSDIILRSLSRCPEIKYEEISEVELPIDIEEKAINILPIKKYNDNINEEYTSNKSINLYDIDYENIDAASRGTYLHACLEKLPLTTWNKEDLDIFDSLTDKDKESFLELSNSELYKEAISYNEVYKEYPFIIKDETSINHRTFDFIAISDSKVIIIDYKSNKATVDSIKNKEQYQKQLSDYAKYAGLMFKGKMVEAYIYSIENKCFIRMD